MKKLLSVLFLLSATFLSLYGQGSRIVTDSLQSPILGVTKAFNVYIPAGYEDSGKDYPVLYLLHGAWGDNNCWARKGNLQKIADKTYAAGLALPAVIIMPDASGDNPDKDGYRMGYFDKEGWLYETYFFEELIPYIENKYRIKGGKNSRAIGGLSMGGGGAMVYALHRPDMFGSCCPLSGLLGSRPLSIPMDDDFMDSVTLNDPQTIISNASDTDLENFRMVRWFIDCGDDDFLAHFNVRTFLLMKEKNIPIQFRIRDGGHTWEYWQESLPVVLQFISTGFAQ